MAWSWLTGMAGFFLILVLVFPTGFVFGDSHVGICPSEYFVDGKVVPLQAEVSSANGGFNKVSCKYGVLSSSSIVFEIAWSANGYVSKSDWCQGKLKVENGFGSYQQKESFVRVIASGIQLGTEIHAEEMMKTIAGKVNESAFSCPGYESSKPAKAVDVEVVLNEDRPLVQETGDKDTKIVDETTRNPDSGFDYFTTSSMLIGGIGLFVMRKRVAKKLVSLKK